MDREGGAAMEAMAQAARRALDYRKSVATAERTPVASYADIYAAFDAPTPDAGGDPQAIIEELAAGNLMAAPAKLLAARKIEFGQERKARLEPRITERASPRAPDRAAAWAGRRSRRRPLP